MANNGGCRHTPGILQPHGEPGYRGLMCLCEVVAHDRLKLFFDKFEMLDKGFMVGFYGRCQLILLFAKQLASFVERQIFGPVSSALD